MNNEIIYLKYKLRRKIRQLVNLIKREKESPYSAFFKIGMALHIGAIILNHIKQKSKLEEQVKGIDDKLLVKRFWLIGKAYQKTLEESE